MISTQTKESAGFRSTSAQRDTSTVQFPLGLLGFEGLRKFTLVGKSDEAPFLWLERQNDSGLAFLVAPVNQVVPDYKPDVSMEDVRFLKLSSPLEALVLGIVTFHKSGQATINLKGPLVINARTRLGKQVVPLNAAGYNAQHPLPVTN